MDERIEFDTGLPAQAKPAWETWANRMGFSTFDVPLPGWIERRESDRTVTYLRIVRDGDGMPLLACEAGTGCDCAPDEPCSRLAQRVCTIQLEAAPLPFPALPDGYRRKVLT